MQTLNISLLISMLLIVCSVCQWRSDLLHSAHPICTTISHLLLLLLFILYFARYPCKRLSVLLIELTTSIPQLLCQLKIPLKFGSIVKLSLQVLSVVLNHLLERYSLLYRRFVTLLSLNWWIVLLLGLHMLRQSAESLMGFLSWEISVYACVSRLLLG